MGITTTLYVKYFGQFQLYSTATTSSNWALMLNDSEQVPLSKVLRLLWHRSAAQAWRVALLLPSKTPTP